MDKATYGLIGVVLGVLLTIAKEYWFQSKKNKKDAEYLAIHVVCTLDRYVAGCAEVVGDDGLCDGQPDENGCYRIQVAEPKFEANTADVEWKSLPASLMYEIFAFPNKIEITNNLIRIEFEYSAAPPYYSEGFEERQLRYADLGIEAADIASKLRLYAELPIRPLNDWDPVEYMREHRQKILTLRAERAERRALFNSNSTDLIEKV